MGKIDDMRRQREEQAAKQQREHEARIRNAAAPAAPRSEPVAEAPAPKSAPSPSPSPAPEKTRAAKPAEKSNDEPAKVDRQSRNAKADKGDKTEGKCSGCGKLRPLVNGMVGNHQKGFGKMCSGSRKAPA